ncbi:MAG: gfo/Idh/MocA family oxidoreductase, partial [Chloroflexota bacterium]
MNRKLKFGQIGGGRDSFIGAVHRRAAISDGKTELVAGAF